VNEWAQAEPACELAETTARRLSPAERNAVFASRGAGESYGVIAELLETSAQAELILPSELGARPQDWLAS
jgi:hypothetical protein